MFILAVSGRSVPRSFRPIFEWGYGRSTVTMIFFLLVFPVLCYYCCQCCVLLPMYDKNKYYCIIFFALFFKKTFWGACLKKKRRFGGREGCMVTYLYMLVVGCCLIAIYSIFRFIQIHSLFLLTFLWQSVVLSPFTPYFVLFKFSLFGPVYSGWHWIFF